MIVCAPAITAVIVALGIVCTEAGGREPSHARRTIALALAGEAR